MAIKERGPGATLLMACVGVFVAYLPVTTVSVSLPAIGNGLGASTADLSWVQDAFVLPMAALILSAGVFGDAHGRKKVYQAGLALCAIGAAVALCAHSIGLVWLGQALAGAGAAALLPATLALISHAVPDHRERGKYVGLWATALLVALAAGPLIAGGILEHASWRWIFLPAVPVAVLTLIASVPLVEDSQAAYVRHLDWPGQITVAVGIVALVYGVIEGGAGGFTGVRVIGSLVLALIFLGAFVVVQRRAKAPMLDPELFRSRGFVATAAIAMITFLAVIGSVFVLSLYFGLAQRLSTLQAGLRLLAFTAVPIVTGPIVARLMHRIGVRALLTTGLALSAVALGTLSRLGTDASYGQVGWRLALFGLGLGLVFTPMTATAVSSVPHHLAGMAGAGSNAFRQFGGALGPALLGAALTGRATATLPGHLQAAGVDPAGRQAASAAMDDGGFAAVAAGAHGDPGVLGGLGQAFLDGFQVCLLVAGGLMLLAAVVALVALRTPASAPARPEPEPVAV